ncbi:MAG TPA: glycosyltransferase family 4 protein [Candidatus Elarobacter sp.]|nr:glycosyltransferase family 4 protein [Candidatus Elarobacter sp.]
MRALLVVRSTAHAAPGGDVVHAERTATALRSLGAHADLVATEAPDARGYDVAHVFGVFDPDVARRQIDAIRACGTPIVLSPIWLDLRALFAIAPFVERALSARTPAGVERRIAALRRIETRLPWRGSVARNADRRLDAQRRLVLEADVVLPASNVEAYLYGERLRVHGLPFVVAPLGVYDEAFAVERPAARSGVLCVGRVEPKKNQAALLYALRDVDVDVTIVGAARDAPYLALCRRWATRRTRFVAHAAHHEVLAMMARCAVHAHPSWLETPGLASLEAAAAGTRVVVGDRGCEREYFGPDVDYADPADPATIHDAVVRALRRGDRDRGDALERRLGAFTWQRTGLATLDAYARASAARA